MDNFKFYANLNQTPIEDLKWSKVQRSKKIGHNRHFKILEGWVWAVSIFSLMNYQNLYSYIFKSFFQLSSPHRPKYFYGFPRSPRHSRNCDPKCCFSVLRTNEWTGGFTLTLRVDLILPRKMIHTVTQPSYPIKDVSTIFQKLENYNLLCFADTSPLCFVVDLYHLTWRLSNGYPRNFERQSEKGSTVPPTRFRTKPENSCYTSKYQTHKRRVKLVKEKHKMIKYIHPKLRYRQNLL